MRLSSHLSSSTFSIGKLEAARVNPVLRRRIASSRPRLCGIETTRGADILKLPNESNRHLTVCNFTVFEMKRMVELMSRQKELCRFPFVFPAAAQQQMPTCRGMREILNVH